MRFPQLRDENWIRDHLDQLSDDLGAASIARELHCHLQTAKKALHRFGFYRRKPWTPVELKALEVFYPYVEARLLAQALNRPRGGVWKGAWRRGIKSQRPHNAATPEESHEFWDTWQRFILEEFVLRPAEQAAILGFTWRAAKFESDCGDCVLQGTCPRDGTTLPCEQMTIADYLTEGVIGESPIEGGERG